MALDPVTGMALGGIGQGIFGYLGQREANKTNIKLADQARTHDVNMWDKQNQYNTPEMHMQRLREAGLNPSLVGGQAGQVGQADQPKSSPVPQVQNELAQMAQMNLVPMLQTYSDMQVKGAQVESIDQDILTKKITNELLKSYSGYGDIMRDHDLRTKQYRAEDTYTGSLLKDQEYQVRQEGLLKEIGLQKQTLQQKYELGESQKGVQNQTIRALQMENAMNLKLKPYGMTSRDALWQRKLIPIIEKWIDDLGPGFGKNLIDTFNPFSSKGPWKKKPEQ